MKIAYLSDSKIPSRTANSIHVMKMCQAFAKGGNEVILLSQNPTTQESEIEDAYCFYGVEVCFQLNKLPRFNVKGGARIYGMLAALKAKTLNVNLAYGRCLQSCFLSSLLGVPVIYESHKLPTNPSKLTSWMFSYLIQSHSFQRLVVISDALRQAYQQHYSIPSSKILVAHDGADDPGKVEKLAFAQSDRLQVGYVGHLYPGKGMEIVAELVKACPWADFHVIGGTKSDINHWKFQLSGFNNICFHGFIPHAQTEQYRQSCHVLLAPYQRSVSTCGGGDISQWMSPLKIFEYMAAGKPIMTSDLPVLREVLAHKETAWLCEPDDIDSWVTGLARLSKDSALRESLGKKAREEFEAKYTWQARASKVLENLDIQSDLEETVLKT